MPTLISPAEVHFNRCNNLCIYKGSDWVIPVTICSRTDLVDTPVDISGMTGRCSIKKNLNDENTVAQPTVEISDTETGLFTISLPSSLSQNIPTTGGNFNESTMYQYEVRLVDSVSQSEYRCLYGTVEVIPSGFDSND